MADVKERMKARGLMNRCGDSAKISTAAGSKATSRNVCRMLACLCTAVFAVAILLLIGCGTNRKWLEPRQQRIAQLIERVGTAEVFIADADTIRLSAPDTVLIDYDISVAFSDSIIAIGNRIEKNVVLFSRDGEFIRAIGQRGLGPGEFQGVYCVAVGPGDRIYVYDHWLERISVFSPNGDLKAIWSVGALTSYYVRDMGVGPTGLIFLHHAPSEQVPGFVSVWDSTGNLSRIVLKASDSKYRSYFKRGVLDGGIQISPDGVLFESNIFSYRVWKVYPNWVETSFGEEPARYHPLPHNVPLEEAEELHAAISRSTIILKPLFLESSGLLLQDIVNPPNQSFYQVYDTSGTYLGRVDDGPSFRSESHGFLLGLYPKYGSPKYGKVEQRIPYDIILYKERKF